MEYRSEIDGLRSLAVVPVVLYHFDLLGIRGGFLGVDVFFVISGFLIGGIIISEHAAGTFSFRSFYARRAKRILPALFLVLLVTFPVAWLVLFDDQLESFASSAVSAVFFGANFFFYFKSDLLQSEHPTRASHSYLESRR
jgi:peptidoglycan/LPS O-acetylase OafA/YrhL